jgi:hypothetical protein
MGSFGIFLSFPSRARLLEACAGLGFLGSKRIFVVESKIPGGGCYPGGMRREYAHFRHAMSARSGPPRVGWTNTCLPIVL